MKNLLLDTNIYGELVVDQDVDKLKDKLLQQTSLIFFGSQIVRTELRATPKRIKVGGSNLRIDLLTLYDIITHGRTISLTKEIEDLAQGYYRAYRKLGGIRSEKELGNDFLIVASASFKNMNIIVSDDEATMQGELAIQAYSLVNALHRIHNPLFLNYEQFKKLLR